ncbi:hypothetical protein [Vibrio sp. St2]|uniref:BFO_1060 family glycosyltransferase n=1 Tax=Vibrio sp. St2 TaxID=2853441 RepID=UPI00248EC469|nr:hypothetical protein [Vibrio sp. St2]
MKEIDVLNLEWPGNERDSFSVAPIILELRNKGYTCITGDIFSHLYYLCQYRPKVLLITSFQGARVNHKVCQEAKRLGIKVISLIAEGNLREKSIKEMTWGHNLSREIYFEKMLVWSKRSQDLILKYFPELEEKVVVSGGVGFDRYKLISFKSKQAFINEQNVEKDYDAFVGLAGWGFDKIHETEFYEKNKKAMLASMRPGQIDLHRKDFKLLTQYYYDLVTNNPRTFFIARPHPGLMEYYYDEFKKIKDLPNVYYSKPRSCTYSISDLISICDIWGGYETTTCMEAWLLGKQTFLFNPSGVDFTRDITANGSLIIENYDELNNSMSNVSRFIEAISLDEDVTVNRKKIIGDIIGYDDGKNHLRAVSEIEPVLNDSCYSNYKNYDVIRNFGILQLSKYVIRNINILNLIRGLRVLDQDQVERTIKVFELSKKMDELL